MAHKVRYKFKGVAKQQCVMFKVFDGEFSSFRETLAFASATYKIKKSRLGQPYFDNGESFNRAVEG